MMICFSAILLLLLGLAQGLNGESLSTDDQLLQRELNSLNVQLDTIVLELKEKLHNLKESRSQRIKRDEVPDPANLRHGFVPQTSVGNRESVEILGFQYMPSREVRHTLAFWEYFEYKNEDFLVTYNIDSGYFHVYMFDIDQDPFQAEFLTSVASVEVEVEHVKIFGLPCRTQPIDRYKIMIIALYTRTEIQLYCFQEILNSGNYSLQLNQTISLLDVTDTSAFVLDTDLYFILARCANNTYLGWVRSVLYKWNVKRYQFEIHQSIRTNFPQSVVPLEMENKHYLVFAERLNMTTVWKYDKRQLQFKKHHELFPAGCVAVEEFTLGFNSYIIITNDQHNQSHIFKWSGYRFETFQVIEVENIQSWRPIDSPNCQDGVLLTLSYGEPLNTFVLYEYNYREDLFEALNHTGHFVNGTSYAFRASDNRLFAGVSGPYFTNYVKMFEIYYTTKKVADPIAIQGRQQRRRHYDIVDSLNALDSDVVQAQQLLADSIRLSGDRLIYGTKFFPKLIVNGSLDVDTIKVNHSYLYGKGPDGKDSLGYLATNLTQHENEIPIINATLNDSVSLDFYQDVFGLKTFLNVSFLHYLSTTNLESDVVNDVWIEPVVNNSVWVNRPDQVIQGSVTFTESLQVDGDVILAEDSYVNGVDLSEDVVTTDKEQTIEGDKRFTQDTSLTQNLNFDANIQLNHLDISEEVVTLDRNHTVNVPVDFTDGVHVLGNIITSETVDGILVSTLAENVLTIVGNQSLNGPLVFMTSPSFGDDIDLQGSVNGVDLSDLSQKSIRTNQNETISGDKTFGSDFYVDGKCEVLGLLDGVNLTEIITSKGFQSVTGLKNFTGGLSASVVDVSQTVDRVDLSVEAVTLTGNHIIDGVKTLSYGAYFGNGVDTSGLVDGVNVSRLATSVLTKSGNQTIKGSVTFSNDTTFEADLQLDGLVNEVNVTFLDEDAVYEDDSNDHYLIGEKQFLGNVTVESGFMDVNGLFNGYNVSADLFNKISDQIITGNKTFLDGFDVNSNVTLDGTLDGWSTTDLESLPVLYHKDANITGEKTLVANVTFWQDLEISGRVNGLDISEEAMTVNRAQNITGEKQFASLHTNDDLTVEFLTIKNKLNGLNWQQFVDSRVTLSGEQTLLGNFNFTDVTHVLGDIEVEGLVNGFNVTRLEENTLRESTEQTITGEKNISGTIDISDDVNFHGLVDGVNITKWMEGAMRLDGDQSITGSKIFEDPLDISGSLEVSELVNGVNVTFMEEDAVMKNGSRPQIITGDKIFEDGFDLRSDLTVNNLVNGINISDVVTLSGNQEISGSYNFTGNVSISDELTVDGLINGVNVSFIDLAALKLNEEENVEAHKIFLDEIIIESDVVVKDGELVDGVDVSELSISAIRLDDPFEFTGEISTTDTITFLGDVDLVGTCDRNSLADWADTVVRINTEQDINGTKVFSGLFSSDDSITVTESLEFDTAFGIDISDWSEDIIYRDENRTVTGEKTFQDDVDIEGSIIVDGTVDGVDLSEEAVTLTEEQTITGKKIFTQAVHSKEDVEVSDLVNGFYLPALNADTFNLDEQMNVTGAKTFLEEVVVKGNVYLSGLNGSYFEVPVNLFDNYHITGFWIFDGETSFTNNLYITGLASHRNLTELQMSRVTLSGDGQVIYGPLNFTGDVIFESDVGLEGAIDGVDLLAVKEAWLEFLDETEQDLSRLQWLSSQLCGNIDDLQEIYADTVADFDYFTTVQDIPQQTQNMIAFTYRDTPYLAVAVYAQDHIYTCVESYIYSWDELLGEFVITDSVLTNGAMKFAAFQIEQWQFLAVANAGIIPCAGDDAVFSSLFIFNTSLVPYQTFEITAVDVEAFSVHNRTYLVFAGEDDSLQVYVHSLQSRQFLPFQTISTDSSALAVEFINVGDKNLLIVAESASEIANIYVIEEGGNFTLYQTVSSRYAYDITGYSIDGKAAVIFAGYSTMKYGSGLTGSTESLVYIWSEDSDMFVTAGFVIPFEKACDVGFITLGFHSYIILVEQYVKVELFRYEGSGHFVSAISLPIPGIRSVEGFTINDDVYLALAISPLMDSNPSKIMKAVLQGHVYETVTNLCDFQFGEMASHTYDDLCY